MNRSAIILAHFLYTLTACTSTVSSVTEPQANTETFWVLDLAMVHRLETRIVMPEGAKPIGAFTRYYEAGFDQGRRVVLGLLTEDGDGQIHIGHKLTPLDGGCSVVTLAFDVAADRITSIDCNGLA